jgi:hypothetical protein
MTAVRNCDSYRKLWSQTVACGWKLKAPNDGVISSSSSIVCVDQIIGVYVVTRTSSDDASKCQIAGDRRGEQASVVCDPI